MNTNNSSAPARDIPTPPGGGSWTFDEEKWAWVSNDPLPHVEESFAEESIGDPTIEQEQ